MSGIDLSSCSDKAAGPALPEVWMSRGSTQYQLSFSRLDCSTEIGLAHAGLHVQGHPLLERER